MKNHSPFHIFLTAILILAGCTSSTKEINQPGSTQQFILILGIAQDGGYPQIGCAKECCAAYASGQETKKHVTSLAIVDGQEQRYWLIEATPDINLQLSMVQENLKSKDFILPSGIFLTHAHMGHYTGLMQLGREALGGNNIPVWVMPKMDSFLRKNGPWSQLVNLKNIQLHQLKNDSTIVINNNFRITPILVPHRDEFSETVGFIISSSTKKVLFVPDIDKWEKWNRDIRSYIQQVDIALLDGTFFKNGELPNRDMSEVPHPFIEESMKWFDSLSAADKTKIKFIHFNHTNPLLRKESLEKTNLLKMGYRTSEEGMKILL